MGVYYQEFHSALIMPAFFLSIMGNLGYFTLMEIKTDNLFDQFILQCLSFIGRFALIMVSMSGCIET
jgi:hypothetical protein